MDAYLQSIGLDARQFWTNVEDVAQATAREELRFQNCCVFFNQSFHSILYLGRLRAIHFFAQTRHLVGLATRLDEQIPILLEKPQLEILPLISVGP